MIFFQLREIFFCCFLDLVSSLFFFWTYINWSIAFILHLSSMFPLVSCNFHIFTSLFNALVRIVWLGLPIINFILSCSNSDILFYYSLVSSLHISLLLFYKHCNLITLRKVLEKYLFIYLLPFLPGSFTMCLYLSASHSVVFPHLLIITSTWIRLVAGVWMHSQLQDHSVCDGYSSVSSIPQSRMTTPSLGDHGALKETLKLN